MLVDKNIVVGITGGIAAYKSCELVREIRRLGAEVRVIMTEAATEFVAPLTFATLTEQPVTLNLFDEGDEQTGVQHIDLARWADALVICPATANILAKVANGLADDALSTTLLATRAPVIFCPAMNSAMWENPAVQENVAKLKARGFEFVDPEWGALATTAEGSGWGRLAPVHQILSRIKRVVLGTDVLADTTVLVTAGPTREPVDPVRFITNHASGKMGFALAEAARLRGAEVILVSGPNHLQKPDDVTYVEVESVEQMWEAVQRAYAAADALVMAAAVADYKPRAVSRQKIKKSQEKLVLEMDRTMDILAELADDKGERVHVGFAVETENELANARKKLLAKNLDMVVVNNPLEAGSGFGWDTNKATILTGAGASEALPKMSKFELAGLILDKVAALLKARKHQSAAN